MVNLRLKKANLLGFNTYADFALDDRMAKTDANVNDLINRVWTYAIPRAKEEVADMQTRPVGLVVLCRKSTQSQIRFERRRTETLFQPRQRT